MMGCGCQPSVDSTTSKHSNQARSTHFNGKKVIFLMLVFLCLFLGIAVVHLKVRQMEIEEKFSLLSSQMDVVLQRLVGHELLGNMKNINNGVFEKSDKIYSFNLNEISNSVKHRDASTNSETVRNKTNSAQVSEINFDFSLMNPNSRNDNYVSGSKFGFDLAHVSDIDQVYMKSSNVNKSTANSSFLNEQMPNIIRRKRRYNDIFYKNISASRTSKKFFPREVKLNVPYIQSDGNSSQPEEWKINDNEDASEEKLLSRVERSNRRKGKKHRLPQSGRTHHCKKSRYCGPVSLHFKGAVPERIFQDGGVVAPWFQDKVMSGSFGAVQFELKDGGFLEVSEAGMYLIYAQVYYLTTEMHNSFAINVMERGKTQTLVALCSSHSCARGPGDLAEVSCFTSVARFLNASDQVYILQRERNRRILMRDGQSFLGLVKLQ